MYTENVAEPKKIPDTYTEKKGKEIRKRKLRSINCMVK
jgi:hypothetical protein